MKHARIKPVFAALALVTGLLASVPALAAGNVTIAVNAAANTLDPYDTSSTLAQAMDKSFYEGLFTFDQNLQVQPLLATGYAVGEDARTYTIHLRPGVSFQDGTAFDAEAVKVNFERVMDPANGLARYGQFSRIRTVEALDSLTVRIILKVPYSAFINSLAHPSAAMISPAALKKWGKDIAYHPTGTGPFEFVSWDPSHSLVVRRFAGYWQKGLPYIDTLTFRTETDDERRARLLTSGQAQLAYPLPYRDAKAVQEGTHLRVVAAPSIITRYVSMNTLQKPFDDVRVREAINYAINKGTLVRQAFYGYAQPASGVIPMGVQFARKMGYWPYDPDKARALLKAAGYPEGFATELWSNYNDETSVKVLDILQHQLAQVGIRVAVNILDPNLNGRQVERAPDPKTAPVRLYFTGWSASTGEADWALRPVLSGGAWPPTGDNTAYYANQQVDDNLRDALLKTSAVEKEKLYADAQERIWQDAPWAFLLNLQLLSVQDPRLHGFHVMPDGSFLFTNIRLDAPA